MATEKERKPNPPIEGDYGLGLCAQDVTRYAAGETTQRPRLAITMIAVTPELVLPACYACILELIQPAINGRRPGIWAPGRG